MSKEIRLMINKVDNFKKLLNENYYKNRIYISKNGTDGFGYVMNIRLKDNRKKIGSIVFRKKTYLESIGFPVVLELHIGFNVEYQRQGFFQDAIIALLDVFNIPVYIASGRVINPDVFKAIAKLDDSLLTIDEIDSGFIITKK